MDSLNDRLRDAASTKWGNPVVTLTAREAYMLQQLLTAAQTAALETMAAQAEEDAR